MKLLFVSGVSIGGACRSTLDLAEALARRGNSVTVLLGNRPPSGSAFDLGVRALAKLFGRPGARIVEQGLRRVGRRARPIARGANAVRILGCRVPENGYLDLVSAARPDAVIVNSLPRMAFRWMHADLMARGIPIGLYIRESHAITHLTVSRLRPDLVLSNSGHFADLVAAAGLPCTVVPSAVDCAPAATESARTAALLVNPVVENRPDILLGLADARPDIPFVLQESWPLSGSERAALLDRASRRRNVSFRAATSSPAEIYRDARVLLATYPNGRPRVVAEAQHNGIPVIGLAQPALAEAVGAGGVLIGPDEPLSTWLTVLAGVWDDERRYADLSRICRERAARTDTAPDAVAERFESLLRRAVP